MAPRSGRCGTVTNRTLDPAVEADIAIIGSGPAGLAVAEGLRGRGLDVLILESGGTEESDARELAGAETVGDPIFGFDLVETRRRQVGGNANQWVVKIAPERFGFTFGVRYARLTDLTLERRAWIPGSGWPIGPDELDRWTRRAHELVAVGPYDYDPDPARSPVPDPMRAGSVDVRRFRFGPRDRIRHDLVARVRADPRCRLIEHATVTALHQETSGGPIDGFTFVDASGAARRGRARAIVVAGGAVENARLLLASERERGGIGNEHDQVGRHFMEHALYSIGDIDLADPADLARFTAYDLVPSVDGAVHDHVVTSRAWCEANDSVEIALNFFPRPPRTVVEAIERTKSRLRTPAATLTDRRGWSAALADGIVVGRRLPWAAGLMARRQSLLPGFGRGGWSSDPLGLGFTEVEVLFQVEQAPRPGCRVTLADDRDRNGIPLPRVDWQLGEQTRRSVLALQGEVAARVDELPLGTYRPRTGGLEDLRPPASIVHHSGTTRMSTDPRDGVTDADGRVHTAPDLYLAGSSLFPAAGYANPTLTIVALGLRLADTLAGRLGSH